MGKAIEMEMPNRRLKKNNYEGQKHFFHFYGDQYSGTFNPINDLYR